MTATIKQIPIIALAFIAVVVFFLSGWVAEDAYITFRVIDNFVHGYGLRWNADERVQAYTHPFWMLINIPLYMITKDVAIAVITMSVVCAAGGVYQLYKLGTSRMLTCCVVILTLLCSSTIRHYMVSGLENPLTFFLLCWLIRAYIQKDSPYPYRIFFIAGLLILSRMDNIFIVAPLLFAVMAQNWKQIKLSKLLLCVAIPAIWFLFSLIYYGFFLPNTKYAKMNLGFSAFDLAPHGLHYLWASTLYDPAGILFIIISFILLGWTYSFKTANRTTGHAALLIFAGLLLHLAYVVSIGGDYMAGRFLFTPILAAAIVILQITRHFFGKKTLFVIALLGIGGAFLSIYTTEKYFTHKGYQHKWQQNIVGHERAYHLRISGVMDRLLPKRTTTPNHPWARKGMWARNNPGVHERYFIGMFGYYAGPNAIIIDRMALADPLLARMPPVKKHPAVAGHYHRELPRGYMHARRTGDTSLMLKRHANYYKKLHLVTSGPLFSPERLRTIIGFQLDRYSHKKKKRKKRRRGAPLR